MCSLNFTISSYKHQKLQPTLTSIWCPAQQYTSNEFLLQRWDLLLDCISHNLLCIWKDCINTMILSLTQYSPSSVSTNLLIQKTCHPNFGQVLKATMVNRLAKSQHCLGKRMEKEIRDILYQQKFIKRTISLFPISYFQTNLFLLSKHGGHF